MADAAPQAPGRRGELVGAAYRTFMAVGFAKASMSDVASAAHVSRPTLYREFENKNDVFVAVVEQLHRDAHQRYERAAAGQGTLADRLADVSISKVMTVLDVVRSSVHGAELLDVNQRLAGAAAASARADLSELFAGMFRSADGDEIDLAVAGIDAAAAARAVLSMADGWIVALTADAQRPNRRWRHELTRSIALLVKGMQPT